MTPRRLRLLLPAALAASAARRTGADMQPPRTFGVGYTAAQAPVCATPTLLLNYSLSPDAELGILSHFWATGDVDSNVVVEYFVDGEAAPSIAFEPSMASGQGFQRYANADPLAQQAGLYEAAGKMGKAGPVGGWYHKYKVPFGRSLRAQIRLISGTDCQYAYIQIRGHEVFNGEPGVVLPSGAALPRAARMQLQTINNATFAPLQQVALANVSRGMSAVLFMTTLATSTYPPMNNYIEGCFHLLRTADEPFPGLVVGTARAERGSGARPSDAYSPLSLLLTRLEPGSRTSSTVHIGSGLPRAFRTECSSSRRTRGSRTSVSVRPKAWTASRCSRRTASSMPRSWASRTAGASCGVSATRAGSASRTRRAIPSGSRPQWL
jgi:hypothetical protein